MRSNPLAPRTVAKDQVVLHNVFALAETRVTRWLAEEKNPVLIQRAMEHADLATTMGYPHLVDGAFPALVEEPEWGSSGHPGHKPCPKWPFRRVPQSRKAAYILDFWPVV